MKKQLLIISVIIVIVSIFVSCSVNSSSEDVSTTAVTDSYGTTHYYKSVTDENGSTVLAEIETKSNGSIVTNKNGTYVIKKHTTVVFDESSVTKPASNSSTTVNGADNIVEFEPTDASKETKPDITTATESTTIKNEITTQKETQLATDKDGWITKWY